MVWFDDLISNLENDARPNECDNGKSQAEEDEQNNAHQIWDCGQSIDVI